MIKKISAILLALVLCLSVVVVPASALGSDMLIGYTVEFDKESYSAGETATVNVYFEVADGYEWGTGALVIGFNSAVFSIDDNSNSDIAASASNNDAWGSFYVAADSSTWAWQEGTTALDKVKTNIVSNNSDNENALYDQFLKVVINRDLNASHDNAALKNNGLPSEDINGDTNPFVSFQLVVSEDATDGTAVSAAVVSGAMAKNYCYMNYYKNPGSAQTVVKTTAAQSEIVAASSTIGEPTATSIITNGKAGIRFEKNADDSYAEKISVRTKAQIDGSTLQGLIGGITDNEAVEKKILKAGFVYIADANGTLNATTAQTVAKTKAKGESIDSHINAPVEYIQYDGTNYSFTCLITPIAQTEIATASFNSYAYIVIDVNGDGVADDGEWYFADAAGNAVSAKTLYNNNNDRAWAQYGWGTATDL